MVFFLLLLLDVLPDFIELLVDVPDIGLHLLGNALVVVVAFLPEKIRGLFGRIFKCLTVLLYEVMQTLVDRVYLVLYRPGDLPGTCFPEPRSCFRFPRCVP